MSPQIITNTKKFMVFFLFALLGLGLVSILIPTLNSFAEEVDVNLGVDANISLSLSDDEVNIDVVPNASAATGSGAVSALVSTNSIEGYTLTMSAKTEETALIHSSDSITDKIVTSGASSINTLAVNNWAYQINDDTALSPIPAVSSPVNISTTTEPSNSSMTNFEIDVKIDSTLTSGTYSNTLVFSAVANEVPITWDTIENMQDMTAEICSQAATPSASATTVPTATLTDTRDGKTYKVSKLADGHCWMSQNLALGGNTPITLTPADSNVTSNWTLAAADTAWVSSNTDPHYWIDSANQTTYGNYYNWPAATAGSGATTAANSDAPQSICPKGWRLPKGGDNGEFKNLITTTYGITDNAAGSTKLQSAPLSFPLSGGYNSGLQHQGSNGFYWSSTAYSNADQAYILLFYSSYVVPEHYFNRDFGLPVRCLAE